MTVFLSCSSRVLWCFCLIQPPLLFLRCLYCLMYSQGLQCNSVPAHLNHKKKQKEFFKVFSSSPYSSSSSLSSSYGMKRLLLLLSQQCKERRLPLPQVSKPCFLLPPKCLFLMYVPATERQLLSDLLFPEEFLFLSAHLQNRGCKNMMIPGFSFFVQL